MQGDTDKYSPWFFAGLIVILGASIFFGYEHLVVYEQFEIFTDEESVPAFIVSSSDSE